MKLIALKEHTPDGSNRYKVGQRFEISAASARLLIALNLAKLDVEDDKREDDKRSHLYKRRDMKAESLKD